MRKCSLILLSLALALLPLFTGGCTSKIRKARHLARGDKYFDAGDYAKAEIEYLNVLQRDFSDARAFTRLAVIYYEEGRFLRAYPALLRAVQLNTNNLDLHLKLGSLYLAGGKIKEAREQANFVLSKDPRNAEAPVLLAESIAARKEVDEIQSQLEKLSAQIGETAALQLAMGTLHFHAADLTNAETAFQRAAALDPKSSEAHYALGNLRLFQKELKGAEAEFKTAADLAPPRSARRVRYAEFKIQTGDLAEGKRLLAELTKQVPDYLPPWLRQAEIALAEKDYTNCASFLNHAQARDPGNFEASLLHGRLLLAQNQPAKAAVELERLCNSELGKRDGRPHFQLGLASLLGNDLNKALRSFNQAVKINTNYTDAVLALSELNLRKGDTASALSSLRTLVNQHPEIPQGHLLLASAYTMDQNLDEAVAVYRHMSELFPKSPQVPFYLGLALVQEKKFAEARAAFEKSLELSPGFLPAFEQLLNLDLDQKDFARAFHRIQTELEKTPDSALLQLLLGRAHFAQANEFAQKEKEKLPPASRTNIPLSSVAAAREDVKSAETAFLKAIDLDPNLQPTYLLLSQLYVAANQHQQALDRLTALIAKTNNIGAMMQIGMIYDAQKNYPAARDAYEKLLAINPNFTPALNNLAYLYSEPLNQLDKAYQLADKARQLLPNDPFSADTFGWIVYKRQDYNRALGLIQESASRLTSDPEIQFHLGMAHYMMGEEKLAAVALQRALEIPKEFRGKDEITNRLALLAIDPATAAPSMLGELETRLKQEPNDPIIASRLAGIYERNGSPDKAITAYEAVLKQNRQNVQIMARLVELYSARPSVSAKALDLAKEAHGLAPEDARISLMLGRLVASADHSWALSLIEEAASRLPNHPEAQYQLAWAYYNVGRVNEAETTMQTALGSITNPAYLDDARQFLAMLSAGKTPSQAAQAVGQAKQILRARANYIPALIVSGLAEESQGHASEAQRIYETVLGLNSSFTPATRQLGLLLARDSTQTQKAYDLLLKARQAFADDSDVARALGLLAYQRKDDSRAAQLLAQCAESRKDDADLRYYLGMAHYRLKHWAEAKTALQQALSLNLQSNFATEAKRVLSELK